MCATCGCDSNGQAIIHDHEHHDHEPSIRIFMTILTTVQSGC